MHRFNKGYFVLTVILLFIEVLIAMFVRDDFIRPYFGDFLVVILMYCFIRTFMDLELRLTAIIVLLLSYLIELLQYLNFVERIGLGDNEIARTLIGTSFAWMDLIAYTTGIMTVLWFEGPRKLNVNLPHKKL